jgi:hypothetical protein
VGVLEGVGVAEGDGEAEALGVGGGVGSALGLGVGVLLGSTEAVGEGVGVASEGLASSAIAAAGAKPTETSNNPLKKLRFKIVDTFFMPHSLAVFDVYISASSYV